MSQFRNNILLFANAAVRSFNLVSAKVADQTRTGVIFKVVDLTASSTIPVFHAELGKVEDLRSMITRDHFSAEKGHRLASQHEDETSGASAAPDFGMYEGAVCCVGHRYFVSTSGWEAHEDAAHGLIFLELTGMRCHADVVEIARKTGNQFYLQHFEHVELEPLTA